MPSPRAAPSILIIDENAQDIALFKGILEGARYLVSDSNSGKSGLLAIQRSAFDLVIIDLNLPDMDGFEFLRAMRHLAHKPKVLVVSSIVRGNMLEAAKMLGADAVLDKLVTQELLAPTVANLVGV